MHKHGYFHCKMVKHFDSSAEEDRKRQKEREREAEREKERGRKREREEGRERWNGSEDRLGGYVLGISFLPGTS